MSDLPALNLAEPGTLAGVSFVVRHTKPIRTLPGFSRANHRVPTSCDRKSQDFVERLGRPLIQKDLEDTFQQLRQSFGYKRRQLESSDTDAGFGTISTPDFVYSSSICQSESDPDIATWQRDISRIKKPALFLEIPAFSDTFDTVEFTPPGSIDVEKLIDHIEDLDRPNIQADYDRGITFCHILLHELVPQVRVTRESLLIVHPEPTNIPSLMASVQKVQTQLIRFADLT